MDIRCNVLLVASVFSWFVPGGLTSAPADSGSAAAGTHLVHEKYKMLAKRSVYPCRCPLSQAVSPHTRKRHRKITKIDVRLGQEAEMDASIVDRVVEQLKTLPNEMQWRVLEFTRALSVSAPHGVSGKQLLRFAGAVPLGDVKLMREVIEQGCEKVDANEW